MLGQPGDWQSTIVYGLAHLGKSLFWYSGEILFAFYLTEQVGLPPAQMGIVLGLGLIVSAGLDLIVAASFRRTLSNAVATSQLQLLGSILSAGAFLAVFLGFWVPAGASFIYALAAGFAFRLAYAIFDLPQNALMALATSDSTSRDRVASTRIWFSGVAILIVALAVGPLVADPSSSAGATRYLLLALFVGVPAVLGAGVLARIVIRGHAEYPRATRPDAHMTDTARLPAVFWLMMVLMVVTSLATPIFSKLEPYFASFVIRSPLWGGVIVTAMAVGIVLGQPVWAMLCRRRSRAVVMIIAATLQTVSLIFFGLLSLDQKLSLAAAAFVFGLGNGGVGMILWGAFSETVAVSARGREGIFYASFTAISKLTLGIGGLSLGAALAVVDYRGSQSDSVVTLMTTIPATGALVIIVIGVLWLSMSERRSNATPPR